MADLAAARRLLLARLACVRRYADWPRTFWRAPYALLLGSPCLPTPWRQLTHSVACLLAVCVSGGSNPAGGPGAPRRRSGHDVAAELVRSHQAPGTVCRFLLTGFDRVHGVGIVVGSTGLCFRPVCVRGVAPRRFWREGGFWWRFPGREGGRRRPRSSFLARCGLVRAGGDPGPRAGWFKWRGAVVEREKASAPGRRVAPGRRARQLWLLAAVGCVAPCVLGSSCCVVENASKTV